MTDSYEIRKKVLVGEILYTPEQDLDELDESCIHFIYYINDKAIGTVRLIPEENYFIVSRMAVLKEYRGKGIGTELMKKCIEYGQEKKVSKLFAEALIETVDFYVNVGFKIVSDIVIIEDYEHKIVEYYFN